MKKLLLIPLLILSSLLLASCEPADSGGLVLPTPRVPSVSEIDQARVQWQTATYPSYYLIVDEETHDFLRQIRVVVEDGVVVAAQYEMRSGDNANSGFESMSLEEAQNYTVEAMFDRIRQDALQEGPNPVNLDLVYHPLGYPAVIYAEGVPSYNEEGEMDMNFQNSYTYSLLVEDVLSYTIFRTDEPALVYQRAGGEDAYCDTLWIYPNHQSIYIDECRRMLLQLHPPVSLMDELNNLLETYGNFEISWDGDQFLANQINLMGTGSESATPEIEEQIIALADELMNVLSQPVGVGITAVYSSSNQVIGVDMLSFVGQPTGLETSGLFTGGLISQDSQIFVYADGRGLRQLDLDSGDDRLLILLQEEADYFDPLLFLDAERFVVLNSNWEEGSAPSYGWLRLGSGIFNEIVLPTSLTENNCLVDFSVNPQNADQLIATAQDRTCASGLYLIDLETGSSTTLHEQSAATPAWSPDGEWIAFSLADSPEAVSRLAMIHADGSNLTAVTSNTTGHADHPVWREDNIIFSFTSSQNEEGIYQYNLDAGSLSLLFAYEDTFPLSINHNGEFLIFSNGYDLSVYLLLFEEIIPLQFGSETSPTRFIGWLDIND